MRTRRTAEGIEGFPDEILFLWRRLQVQGYNMQKGSFNVYGRLEEREGAIAVEAVANVSRINTARVTAERC